MKCIQKFCIIAVSVCLSWGVFGTNRERPFIWVTPDDRSEILRKIEQQPWAAETFTTFIHQLDQDMEIYLQDPAKYLQGMPFDRDQAKPGTYPPFFLTYHLVNGEQRNLDNATNEEMAHARTLIRYLQTGVDCGIAYFITEEEKYAQCAVDILYSFVKGVQQSEVSIWQGRGGWLFPYDGFREVREIGYKVPLIYDFIAEYIHNGGQPFDLVKNMKTDFPLDEAQQVFRTYAGLTVNYGHTGSNHSILEAPSLVYNALAMDDEKERNHWLSFFLTENTENQDALNVMAEFYRNKGDIWPETSQYLNAASSILTRLMRIVNRYDPSLRLGERYANILYSLPALDYFVFPNDQIIRWGDGKRYGRPPYSSYEDAYLLGEMDGVKAITSEFGSLLARAMQEGKYQRRGMNAVLWYGAEYDADHKPFILPRTDKVPHAGIFLQRHLSTTGDPADGLMCFVGGAHMVHGHAEGMNIELYGCGHVLGVDHGRGRYQQDIHENYSRLFAAHNTVIVNGNSRSDGGWVNLGINTVELIAMEPMPGEEAVSPGSSFSLTRFEDDKGDLAEAYQERTLALIRTSERTGYYVDVFRSRSALPGEFHDYLYHNIGDRLDFLNSDLELSSTPDRFQSNAGLPWVQNSQYRHPGWHYFEDVETSADYTKDVRACFTATALGERPVYMHLFIPGFANREYTRVKAPHTFEAPGPYSELPTPTLVIRKKGEAWEEPFVVVYEPSMEHEKRSGIISVEKLEQQGVWKGLRIGSVIGDESLTQYIISQPRGETYRDETLDIRFSGTFAVITLNQNGLRDIYIGEGDELVFGDIRLTPGNESRAIYRTYQD